MKRRSVFQNIILVIALAVLVYAGYRIYGIIKMYYDTDKLYEDVRDQYTSTPKDEEQPKEKKKKKKKEKPPIDVDWKELKKKNFDVVGWVYVEAVPEISYAIVAADDNDYYLHRDINKNYLYAGCIFVESKNQRNFTDKATYVYGHNMNNGSMFGKIKRLKEQAVYDQSPYFWILTPDANYKYEIFSVFDTDPGSKAYQLWGGESKEFLEWEQWLKKSSVIKTKAEPDIKDMTVLLSTCNHHTQRTLCIGRCVSEDKPHKDYKEYILPEYIGSESREAYIKEMARWDLCASIGEYGEEGILIKASEDQKKNWIDKSKKDAQYLVNAFGGAYGGSMKMNDELTELEGVIIENAATEFIRDTLADIMMDMEAYQVMTNKDGSWKITVTLKDEETGKIITKQSFPKTEDTEPDYSDFDENGLPKEESDVEYVEEYVEEYPEEVVEYYEEETE